MGTPRADFHAVTSLLRHQSSQRRRYNGRCFVFDGNSTNDETGGPLDGEHSAEHLRRLPRHMSFGR